MGGGPASRSASPVGVSTCSSDSMVQIDHSHDEALAAVDTPTSLLNSDTKRLVYSKSAVFVHPSSNNARGSNINGFLCIYERDSSDYYLAWIPLTFLQEEDLHKFVSVESSDNGDIQTNEVSTPITFDELPDNSSSYSFSVPITSIYSIRVQPPTMVAWHGSITINIFGGETLPSLYFHDDESTSAVYSRPPRSLSSSRPPPMWGGESVIRRLCDYSHIIRSSLEPSLYLVNPSKVDYEAHSSSPHYPDDDYPVNSGNGGSGSQTPQRSNSILHESLSPTYPPTSLSARYSPPLDNFSFNVFNQFSKITRTAQDLARPILSLKIAKPILPHLPSPVANLSNATRWQEEAGLDNYDSARVYLAKWARIVAEEGERSRKAEFGSSYCFDDEGYLGAWEVLSSTYKMEKPKASRASNQPIADTEWFAWMGPDGKLLLSEEEAKRRIFQRGLVPEARKSVWPFLLKVFPWDSTREERESILKEKTDKYFELKDKWQGDDEVILTEEFAEENHRIEIDCRRTDRTQPHFALIDDSTKNPEPRNVRSETGGHPPSNHHVRCLQHILLTYNFLNTELGYVQGMSDLCSPLYVVMDADEVLTFWCFVGLMERISANFLRDQSGMKEQLSKLQELTSIMDPQLYKHLEKTESLNLFFCFRWVLILFKREFRFDDILVIWENIFTDVYGPNFHLFFALAILETHRDHIIRYLREFDEVLKYINDLSMTMDPQPLLSHAEVIAKTLKELIVTMDNRKAILTQNHHSDSELRHRTTQKDDDEEQYNNDSQQYGDNVSLSKITIRRMEGDDQETNKNDAEAKVSSSMDIINISDILRSLVL